MVKKMALGRGLGALIEDADTSQQRAEALRDTEEKTVVATELVNEIDINKIEANPYQPRTTFDTESLQELSASISKLGIIQPLTVRELNGGFQLISGERRLRAAKLAGLKTVPAYIRTANDQGMLEMALVENIQRDDLDAIEVAISYQRLVDECNLTHDTLSERVGKKRATVTNYLRLLKLPAEIQLGIKERKLSMGHARSIIGIEDSESQLDLFRKVIAEDLSVRKTEELVRQIGKISVSKDQPNSTIEEIALPQNINELHDKLQEIFGWGVEVKHGKNGSGKIVISYRSNGELDELLARFNRVSE
jgi:ParB family transcriptional regulator, chromosome partitioning protein